MTFTYKEKVEKAIELAENLSQVEYIENRLLETKEINRRTKEGQETTKELLQKLNIKAQELIKAGEQPF